MAQQMTELSQYGQPIYPDGRLDAPACHRNHQPIWAVLEKFLGGQTADVLEVGSGTGQHVVFFARQNPDITWWPSDLREVHLKSIAAWSAAAGLPNVRAPQRIDLSDPDWSVAASDGRAPGKLLAVFCANVIHIAPWPVAQGLVAGAARHLREEGRLFLYGPFKRDGHHTAVSNAVFDTNLRSQDPEWGVRDAGDVAKLAQGVGFELAETFEMPANNLILAFERGHSTV